jgi:hypothetical protein
VTPGTHVINDFERDNGSNEEEEGNVKVGLGGVSSFVWQNRASFPTLEETFCETSGSQFDTSEVDMSAFEDIFDIGIVLVIVVETNRYVWKEISNSVNPFLFCSQWMECAWFWLSLC